MTSRFLIFEICDLHLACYEILLNSATLIIHSERLDHQMSPQYSIFPIWRHKLLSSEYSKTFASSVVDVSKNSYSKVKVAHKNAEIWTRTLFFKHKPPHKAEKDISPWKLFSGCGLIVFRHLVKVWWRKVNCWKININFQRDYKCNQTIRHHIKDCFEINGRQRIIMLKNGECIIFRSNKRKINHCL